MRLVLIIFLLVGSVFADMDRIRPEEKRRLDSIAFADWSATQPHTTPAVVKVPDTSTIKLDTYDRYIFEVAHTIFDINEEIKNESPNWTPGDPIAPILLLKMNGYTMIIEYLGEEIWSTNTDYRNGDGSPLKPIILERMKVLLSTLKK